MWHVERHEQGLPERTEGRQETTSNPLGRVRIQDGVAVSWYFGSWTAVETCIMKSRDKPTWIALNRAST